MVSTELDYAIVPNTLLSPALVRGLRPWQWMASGVMRLAMRAMADRVEIRLEPGDVRPGFCYVIAANHQSMWDPFVICSALTPELWRRLRPFRFFAHNGLFESPMLRWLLLSLGGFPASMHGRYAAGVEAAASFLSHGQTVVIFPQGRRMTEKGKARSGVGVLSKMPNVGVIPARIEWRRERWRWRFGLVVGRPLLEQGLSAQQILNRIYTL